MSFCQEKQNIIYWKDFKIYLLYRSKVELSEMYL